VGYWEGYNVPASIRLSVLRVLGGR
jgi:hypothetical protein